MKEKTDRLYELLPVVYRMRDAERGQPLRALLAVISEQVNVVEADIRQLYDNWFIETCEDWVVPYIADLIGHRMVQEAGDASAVGTAEGRLRNKFLVTRREVANTIRNRRRKGTLSLLELLAGDVSGWPARAVEFYQFLGWTQQLNHLHPERARTADLRSGDALDRINTAFDELAHTVDVRRTGSNRRRGRYSIPGAGLFVWRLNAYSSTESPAYCFDRARNQYTFSLLGNNTQLFTRTQEEPSPTHIADEMNVPAPVRRRALEERTLDYYGEGKSLCLYTWQHGIKPVPVENVVAADLSRWSYVPRGEQVAVDPKLGRIAFSPRHEPRTGVWVTYHYGFSADIGGGEYERPLRPAGDNRKLYRVSQQHKNHAQFEKIGDALRRWKRESSEHPNALIEIVDSGAYVEPLDIKLHSGQRLEIRAANGTRPVIKMLDYHTNRPDSITITGLTAEDHAAKEHPSRQHDDARTEQHDEQLEEIVFTQQQEPSKSPLKPPRLVLDGLLITGRSVQITGELSEVVIRHCTLVPGWSIDTHCHPENETEPSLELTDTNARLRVEHSIVGTILVAENEVTTDPINILVSDSILDATRNDLQALSGPGYRIAHAVLRIVRSTVLGRMRLHAIELGENSIFMGRVQVARSQMGCIRFCYVRPRSRTPRRYNCQPDLVMASLEDAEEKAREEARVRPQFNSTRYGTPQYCQLSEDCAVEIRRGADDESEMGVFHDLFQPQREANLRARLDEFTPAGMDAGLIFVN